MGRFTFVYLESVTRLQLELIAVPVFDRVALELEQHLNEVLARSQRAREIRDVRRRTGAVGSCAPVVEDRAVEDDQNALEPCRRISFLKPITAALGGALTVGLRSGSPAPECGGAAAGEPRLGVARLGK